MLQMKKVPVDTIIQQYEQLLANMKECCTQPIQDKLTVIFEDHKEQIMSAPASGRLNFHNCFIGGFLDHVLRVHQTAKFIAQGFKVLKVEETQTQEDIFMAATFHDWGKLGNSVNEPYYVKQTSSWHQEKLGEYYKHNDKLDYMSVTDRSLYVLQKYKVPVSTSVWKAIKLSDGMFEDGNAGYYKRPSDSQDILYYIIHLADWMSTVAEKQHFIQEHLVKTPEKETPHTDKHLKEMKSKFNELFKEKE
tara:strand:+ start:763 stop:1506 length:744 start_codon:yes stop_codon:yes gene_type:complete